MSAFDMGFSSENRSEFYLKSMIHSKFDIQIYLYLMMRISNKIKKNQLYNLSNKHLNNRIFFYQK